MEEEDAVEPQTIEPSGVETPELKAEEASADSATIPEENDHEQVAYDKTMVPLSALQKMREKKKELELELQWERQKSAQIAQTASKPAEEDNSRFESATREELKLSQEQSLKLMDERLWIRQNPEKLEMINEQLPQFLKQRPHLAAAIDLAPNRYEEAYTLMSALTPKPQQPHQAPKTQKKEAPNSPGGVPKAAALNAVVDVMNMSDAEFNDWRKAQRKHR